MIIDLIVNAEWRRITSANGSQRDVKKLKCNKATSLIRVRCYHVAGFDVASTVQKAFNFSRVTGLSIGYEAISLQPSKHAWIISYEKKRIKT